jgi:PIN domain nuclease of toxin-antitoxin system
LLDTHVALWLLAAHPLANGVEQRLADPANDLRLSIASPWELAIKQRSGKLDGLGDDYLDVLVQQGVELLPITPEHVRVVRDLPLHHRDPFDRMLVAQAQVEGLTLVTRDRRLTDYDVRVLEA